MNAWRSRLVPLKFQLSDWVLFSVPFQLQVRSEKLIDATPPVPRPTLPTESLMKGCQGYLIRGLPVIDELPPISRIGEYLCYVPLQYQHCYIDLQSTFENYRKQFSSKTRSTINRKIKKFKAYCGGALFWKTYQTEGAMREFFRLAGSVSKKTYQERLLNAGLPETETFIHRTLSLAAEGKVRGYILFDGERPVSYLYCPVHDDVLIYAYLGYDPDYMQMSVGTILQWVAVEQMFNEARFRYFDFTEGQSDHKQFFATHQRQCANIFLVNNNLRNIGVVYGHYLLARISRGLGAVSNRLGLKAKIKWLLRFRMMC